jgi:cholera toxin transcriptional activator
MPDVQPLRRYRFGSFEADAATGELRRQGIRLKLNAQPFQVLLMLLERPGELLTREEISRQLWPKGTFVDYEHGVNSAVNRIREALGDSAANPRFIETLARRGYRFIAPVQEVNHAGMASQSRPAKVEAPAGDAHPQATLEVSPPHDETPSTRIGSNGISSNSFGSNSIPSRSILSTPQELPKASYRLVRNLFLAFQLMYLGFYIGALANLPEIEELLAPLPRASRVLNTLIVSAAILIPVRAFIVCAILFRAPGFRPKFLKLWALLLVADVLWSMSPFLLMHHITFGVAAACTALLVYSPFVQRSLVLMGAGRTSRPTPADANTP